MQFKVEGLLALIREALHTHAVEQRSAPLLRPPVEGLYHLRFRQRVGFERRLGQCFGHAVAVSLGQSGSVDIIFMSE